LTEKFVALFDLHWGYDRRGGHLVPVHDPKALGAALNFIGDFKPDHVILGGDMLDCRMISHHVKGKPGQVEGLKLLSDGRLVYHIGNHEDWLNQFADEYPGLEGILDIENVLDLSDQWEVVGQGGISTLGKLNFIHGDQLTSGEHTAKNAVLAYERNIRFGHIHSFQVYTKTSAVDMNGHTAIAVPCLCKKNPAYGKSNPNKWMQGFLWGYVDKKEGIFNDYVSVIVNGKFVANGKTYKG
jgi:metallophosphoesterase superfamily enzyme